MLLLGQARRPLHQLVHLEVRHLAMIGVRVRADCATPTSRSCAFDRILLLREFLLLLRRLFNSQLLLLALENLVERVRVLRRMHRASST